MNRTATQSAPAPAQGGGQDRRKTRGRLGRIVAGSLATGLAAALLLAAAPFIPATESALTGAVLGGFALGWAMLAVLSTRFTDQPQRWAAAPALFMGLGGLLLMVFGSSVHEVLSWVWPPALLALVVGMVVGIRRQLRSRAGRWLLYPVVAVLAVSAVGGGYETVREAVDANAYPMPGQLVDVGGHRLHLRCTGSGSPTVVLEPGAGAMSSSLGWITPAVARDTRVCVYDRAGRGWSDPADTPQDGAQIATDLHTLLHAADVPGPYVLAGHSFGGLYTLAFAARYPDEVVGMVLVDSTAPAPRPSPVTTSPDDAGSYDVVGRVSALASITARLGLARLYGTRRRRRPAAAVPRRGGRPQRHRRQPSQHHRRVRPRRGLRGARRITQRLRRQAAGRPHRRKRQCCRLGREAGPPRHPVHQQRAPHHRRRDPP